MSRGDRLYQLNPGDKKIFEASNGNPNYFSNYYLKAQYTGTWWLPGAKTEHWSAGYKRLHWHWKRLKEPETFLFEGKEYRTEWSHDMSGDYPDDPAYFHNHGMLFLPYHTELHMDMHPFRTIIGGELKPRYAVMYRQ